MYRVKFNIFFTYIFILLIEGNKSAVILVYIYFYSYNKKIL